MLEHLLKSWQQSLKLTLTNINELLTTNKKINQFIQLTKAYFRLYFGIAISIFLFIQFFQPFTADTFEFENKLIFLAGFGVIVLTFLIISHSSLLFFSDSGNNPCFYFLHPICWTGKYYLQHCCTCGFHLLKPTCSNASKIKDRCLSDSAKKTFG